MTIVGLLLYLGLGAMAFLVAACALVLVRLKALGAIPQITHPRARVTHG